MFWKLSKNSSIHNILVITLSNIGDVVLAAPVIDVLLRDFPSAQLSVVVGEKAASLFEGNSHIQRIHIFDKKFNFIKQAQWTLGLRKYHYDAVVDLRNSMIGYFLTPQRLTPPLLRFNKDIHFKERHLNRLRSLYDFDQSNALPLSIAPSQKDETLVDQILKDLKKEAFVLMVPYAADSAKTWPSERFAQLSKSIFDEYALKTVMIGSKEQREDIEGLIKRSGAPSLNLAGQTNLIQTAEVIKRAKIVVANDSGPMHIACYLNKPIVALFGPTNPQISGPWSSLFRVVCSNAQCVRCLNPLATTTPHDCMPAITLIDVLGAFKEIYVQI